MSDLLKDHTNYPSAFAIGDMVIFRSMYRHQQEMGIADEERTGRIVAIRFTECKVFYDILDDYYAKIFDNVDSVKVWVPKLPSPLDLSNDLN